MCDYGICMDDGSGFGSAGMVYDKVTHRKLGSIKKRSRHQSEIVGEGLIEQRVYDMGWWATMTHAIGKYVKIFKCC